jgi:hypothetical protein
LSFFFISFRMMRVFRLVLILAATLMTADAVMLPVLRDSNGQPRAITDKRMRGTALLFTTEVMAELGGHQSVSIPPHFICDARITFDWSWQRNCVAYRACNRWMFCGCLIRFGTFSGSW